MKYWTERKYENKTHHFKEIQLKAFLQQRRTYRVSLLPDTLAREQNHPQQVEVGKLGTSISKVEEGRVRLFLYL